MTLRVKQSSEYQGNDWWQWSVWLDGTAEELDAVDSVTYRLHPTFQDPVRRVTQRQTQFRLDSAGWGEFSIGVTITKRNGKQLQRQHALQLEYPEETAAPHKQPVVFVTSAIADRPTAQALRGALEAQGLIVIEADPEPGVPIRSAVEGTLRSSDAAIAIVSDAMTRLVENEVSAAKDLDIPVLQLIVGDVAALGDESEAAAVHLKTGQGVKAAAQEIAGLVRGIVET